MESITTQQHSTSPTLRTQSAPPRSPLNVDPFERADNIVPTQRSNSATDLNDTSPTSSRPAEDPTPSIILRSRKIDRPTKSNPRKSQRSPLLPSSSSPISKDHKTLFKPSALAMAHLMGAPPSLQQAANDGGLSDNNEDECTITSVRPVNRNDAVASTDVCNSTCVPESNERLRTSLPSYRKLCRTAGVPVNSESTDHTANPDLSPAPKKHIMPIVASHVVQDSNGVIAGYISAMQHSVPAVPASGPDVSILSVEATAPGSNDPLQQLRQHRAAMFGEIIKNSITTTLSTKIRASVADEIRLRYDHLLMEQEKLPNHACSILRTRGKRYWVGVHEFHESLYHYVGRREAREAHLIDEIYSRRDRAIAIYFWAMHQDKMRYAEISFELSLPLGTLLQWILQMCT